MDCWTEQDLPKPTTDLETGKSDLDRFGYCVLAEALPAPQLAALRTRLEEQALAERQTGVGYFDGAPGQNWGSFRDAGGKLRADAFGAGAGVNQRVWMLVNKGQVFIDLLGHPLARALVGHVLGEHYLLSSYTANIANPGGEAMKLHTDQWWMPAPTRRERAPLPAGSIRRDQFDRDDREPLAMVSIAACANIMWMLDDFTEANGATRIVPGSHHAPSPEYGKDVASVPAEMRRGSVLVWHGSLWHGGGANTTGERRVGIAMNYCAGFLRQQENQQLGIPRDTASGFSPRLRELCGYGIYHGLIGHIEKRNPASLLDPQETSKVVWDR
jgi:ectoine hydroxylase-related dioxygenase (phytanoyl-CoA dioxygenase family)